MNRFLWLLLWTAATGCTSVGLARLTPPRITDTRLTVENASLDDVSLRLQLDVENPNDVDVKVNEVKGDVTTEGIPVIPFQTKEAVILKRSSKTKYGVPVNLPWKSALFISEKVLNGKEIPYRIKGRAKVDGITVPFDEKGTLPAK